MYQSKDDLITNGDIIAALEEKAPLSWQESYDNAGLIIGTKHQLCKGVLVCMDVTQDVVQEAIENDCNLIISHHPFIFRGVKKVEADSELNAILMGVYSNNLSIYATHTNMDAYTKGVNFALAKALGLEDMERLTGCSIVDENYFGCGAVGYLPEAMPLEDFLEKVKRDLNLPSIRYTNYTDPQYVKKVGFCGGSGMEFIKQAIKNQCDIYLTGDIKYHDFLEYSTYINIADIGHFESEQFIKQRIIEIISKKITNFARLFESEEKNRIKYI